jgi:hypothetical protein
MESGPRSPAQLFALGLGALLVIVGVAGFFWSASFAVGTGARVEQDFVLGLLAVNGWHNLVHLVTGAIGLAVAESHNAARAYALVVGAVYIVITILGFIQEDAIIGLVAINTEDNILHVLIGVAGVGAGLATRAEPAASAVAS